ncbi:glycosyl hydrolase family 18 protein [Natranaerobius thermophilus]|uniref:Glycoside hydrolase family 18 n=2 Tax=Natranaerobius TaxID=375928 RepID=B2A674_NATTJ|nr:glycosyl hydrolase family 18 protein [Natranaerobius thermophilus]ACB84085.1 glycoside hydrolase family 18 [Natranaerobius thermophilus JW/NM-WN-LF]
MEVQKKTVLKFNIPTLILGLIIFILILASLLTYLYLTPSRQKVEPYPDSEQTRLIYEDQDLGTENTALVEDEVYLSKSFIEKSLDPYIYYDDQGDYITITTKNKFFQMQTDNLTAAVNDEERELQFSPKLIQGEPFLPSDILEELYPITVQHNQDDNLVLIDNLEKQVLKGYAKENETRVREEPSIRTGIIESLDKQSKITIYHQSGDWFFIRTEKGYLGYVQSSDITLDELSIREKHIEDDDVDPPSRPFGEPINLTWEHVISENPNPNDLPDLPGVNVISPTWFHLQDPEGNIVNQADKSYVNWAHDNDMQVWGLFSNNFDPDLTSEFLEDPEARRNAIEQILLYSDIYNLDGINLDFENIHIDDRDAYTQFVREISPFLREQGLVVSIDVTFISQSENWSLSYDRHAFSKTVDYIMVMAYDEHWGDSPVAGSVSSLPWVEENLEEILSVVPNDQLILGIPFYTRLWEEEKNDDGSISVSSSAYGMEQIKNILENNDADITFDDDTKQYYAEYEDNDTRYRTWLETEESIKKRLNLVHEYNLAGVASWRRGFEKEEIWEVIKNKMGIPKDPGSKITD